MLCVNGTSAYFTREAASGEGGRMSSNCVAPRR